jgi:hypothetical protein
LRWQIDKLDSELECVHRYLAPRTGAPKLLQKVATRFRNLIENRRADLKDVRSNVEDGLSIAACWTQFEGLRVRCRPLFDECLQLAQGLLGRLDELDNRLCEIADVLLAEIDKRTDARWERFTIVAAGEFFGQTAEIIRMRYPELSVWSLPIAAHEFGHFFGPEIQDPESRRRPFEEMLAGERRKAEQMWSHLHEQFADVFATYVLGPAYAYTCLFLRFSAATASCASPTHPSAVSRAHIILRTLGRLNTGSKPFTGSIELLRTAWNAAVTSLGQKATIETPDELNALNARADMLYDLVDRAAPTARYSNWQKAATLSAQICSASEPGAADPPDDPDTTIIDVLNGAWQARLASQSDPHKRVGSVAMRLCEKIAKRATVSETS